MVDTHFKVQIKGNEVVPKLVERFGTKIVEKHSEPIVMASL